MANITRLDDRAMFLPETTIRLSKYVYIYISCELFEVMLFNTQQSIKQIKFPKVLSKLSYRLCFFSTLFVLFPSTTELFTSVFAYIPDKPPLGPLVFAYR